MYLRIVFSFKVGSHVARAIYKTAMQRIPESLSVFANAEFTCSPPQIKNL